MPIENKETKIIITVMLCFILLGSCQSAYAEPVSVYYCDGPLKFQDCHITGRGELQCEAINQTNELYVPYLDNRFLAWAYNNDGVITSSNSGNHSHPGQIVPHSSGTVTFPIASGTTKVILCIKNPEDESVDKTLQMIEEIATRSIDFVSVILLIPILITGLLALYLTMYGVFTGRFPNFKSRKSIVRLLRIRWGKNIAKSMAEDWIHRDERPVEFWLSVLAGLLTAVPLLLFSIPLLLEELW